MYACLRRLMPFIAGMLAASGAVHADAIDDMMRAQMQLNHVPGAAVAVIRNGQVEKMQAYGVANLEHNVPVTTSSAFQIASATKIFTGVLLAHLADQGKLSLDDPVTRYLPDAPATWAGITLRHLGNHTAGFGMSEPGPTSETMEQAVAAIMKRPLATRPGEREQYALDDFIVLAHIMQKASGKTYQQLLDEVIIKPLGLENTRFENGVDRGSVNRADVVPGRVSLYSWENGQQRLFWFVYPPASYAAGGLFTSIADIAKVMQAIDRGQLLSEAGRKAVWTANTLSNGKRGGFGIGWVAGPVRGKPAVGHSGGPALGDVLYVPGEHLGVVVLTNQRSLYPVLAKAVAGHYLPAPSFINEAGIRDSDPAQSKRLFELVRALGRGDADGELLAANQLPDLAEQNLWTSRRVSVLPAPSRMVLLSDATAAGKRTRVYRVVYGTDATQRWRFVLDADGKISDFEISDE
ncbi:MAG TPA: serine hydrolase domain-containing protein [Telluria sp.]|nr:serine hydrolase domain-containing protein [Telluria sp.]